jgi:hypothetical protein
MFMRHIGGGVGHTFINTKQSTIRDDNSRDVDIGDGCEDDTGDFEQDEDSLGCEDGPNEEDTDGSEGSGEDDFNDSEDNIEDDLGPEDGEDGDYDDDFDNF